MIPFEFPPGHEKVGARRKPLPGAYKLYVLQFIMSDFVFFYCCIFMLVKICSI